MDVSGVFVPVITPFDGDGTLNLAMLRANIRRLNDTTVAGYMPVGSNGESALLELEEALEVVRTVREEAAPGKMVFAGAGRESLYHTLRFTKQAVAMGVDAVFVLTPHFFSKQMHQEVLVSYYTHVADAAECPVVLYNAPSYAAGVALAPESVVALSHHPNISGMKDSSTTPAAVFLEAEGLDADFFLLAGTLGKFVQSLREGASGGVLSGANYMPEACCQIHRLAASGDWQGAETLHQALCDLAKETTGPYGVAGVKAAMNACGYPCGIPRSPLSALEDATWQQKLRTGEEKIHRMLKDAEAPV